MKRLDEAETVLRAAAEGSSSATIKGHLADVLRERGRAQEALALYEQALAGSGLDDRERKDIEKKREALQTANAASASPAPAASPRP